MTSRIKPARWTVESSRIGYSDRFLTHRMDRCVTERGNVLDPYHVLEFNDWCQVVALTDDGGLVTIEEYRHGGGDVFRGLPSGAIEPGEDPLAATRRELAEETGYVADTWLPLPLVWANPATQNNRIYDFLALGARPAGGQSLDPGETIEVTVRPVAEALADLMSGAWVASGLYVAALLAAREYAVARLHTDPRLAPLVARLAW